jgi:Malectin domain
MKLLFHLIFIVRLAGFTENANAQTFIRINAGGEKFVDSVGQPWGADSYFNGGNATADCLVPIIGTTLQQLYCSYRWFGQASKPCLYEIPVPNGRYKVRLHFSEM